MSLSVRIAQAEIQQLKTEIASLHKQNHELYLSLKRVDEAIFDCIQRSQLTALGKVTDEVMRRLQIYSSCIGEDVIAKLTPRKRGTRR